MNLKMKTNGANCIFKVDVLDLEREAFMSLCGEKRTQDRMHSILKTGKPLRN